MTSKRLSSPKSPVKNPKSATKPPETSAAMPGRDATPEPDAALARKSHRKRKAREFPDAGGKTLLPSPRVWTDDDAAALLRCAADFRARTGSAPVASTMAAFFTAVRPSLPPQITQEQVYNKLRRLRLRHLQGAAPTHGPLVHRLSVRLWGLPDPGPGPAPSPSGAPKEQANAQVNGGNVNYEVEEMEGDVEEVYPYFFDAMQENCKLSRISSPLMVEGIGRADPAKMKALEDKWRRHWHLDMKLKSKQFELSGKLCEMLASA